MRELIEFSYEHGMKAHMITFSDIEDIQNIIDLLENGKTSLRNIYRKRKELGVTGPRYCINSIINIHMFY
jgi:hypothetical protein